MTQGFLTGRYLPRISFAVSLNAVFKVSVNISMSMSESRVESAANFPIIAWKNSAASGSFSFPRSNLILLLHCFLALFRCNLKVSMTSSWVASDVGSWEASGLGNVHTCFESFLLYDVVNLIVCLSVWAVPGDFSGCLAGAKCVCHLRVIVASEFQESSASIVDLMLQ